jgi:putative ABC transport system ATP-binding protein
MVYRIRDLLKVRKSEDSEFRLMVPQLTVDEGEKIALVGPSGCGKSTLLDILAMVLSPTKVSVFEFKPKGLCSTNVASVWARKKLNRLSELRKRHMGYILQMGGLLPYISVHDNINMSCRLLSINGRRVIEPLAIKLGIYRQLGKLPGLLSVGERQRVAIARALAHRPSIVIADEPTASLDPITAQRLMHVLMELTDELGLTVVIASHDNQLIEHLGLRKIEHYFNNHHQGSIIESVFVG